MIKHAHVTISKDFTCNYAGHVHPLIGNDVVPAGEDLHRHHLCPSCRGAVSLPDSPEWKPKFQTSPEINCPFCNTKFTVRRGEA